MTLNISTNFEEKVVEIDTEHGVIQLNEKDALFVAQLLIEKALNLIGK